MQKTIELRNNLTIHKLNYVSMDNFCLIEFTNIKRLYNTFNQIMFPSKIFEFNRICCVVLSIYDFNLIFQRHLLVLAFLKTLSFKIINKISNSNDSEKHLLKRTRNQFREVKTN